MEKLFYGTLWKCSKCGAILDCRDARMTNTFIHCNNCDRYYELKLLSFTSSEYKFSPSLYMEIVTKQYVFEKLLENNDSEDIGFNYILIETGRKEET